MTQPSILHQLYIRLLAIAATFALPTAARGAGSASGYALHGKLPVSMAALTTVADRQRSTVRGATIPVLAGLAAGIAGVNTDRADYGKFNAPGGSGAGYGLIGGPLLSDAQAASFVLPTRPSKVETGALGGVNAIANNYYNHIVATNPGEYLNQLRAHDGFYAAYLGVSWRPEAERIDGACPLAHPTTAEVLQWAANKWGINPLLLYAVATQEGDWDQTNVGDNGTSSGVMQVADRGRDHAWPGFAGAGSMLARENTCFNADFYAARLYSAFHGLTGETPAGDIGAAIQSWYSGTVSAPGEYTAEVYRYLSNQSWVKLYFVD